MKFTRLSLTALITILLSAPTLSLARPRSGSVGMTDFKQKAEAKKQSRWTLSEWLEQKDRNRMMDLWLGMYEPSPYEFILGGQYNSYDTKISSPTETRTRYSSYSGSAAFYAMILGVQGIYENNASEGFQKVEGLVNLRVLGNSNQGTHLNLMYGARKRTQEGFDLNQHVAGVELDLYIEKHIGLHGLYRNYFPVEEPNWGTTTGTKTEVGAFFEVSLIRFYGNWFTDNNSSTLNTIKTERNRSGFEYGLKFYF
jgi:hypothetical protein